MMSTSCGPLAGSAVDGVPRFGSGAGVRSDGSFVADAASVQRALAQTTAQAEGEPCKSAEQRPKPALVRRHRRDLRGLLQLHAANTGRNGSGA